MCLGSPADFRGPDNSSQVVLHLVRANFTFSGHACHIVAMNGYGKLSRASAWSGSGRRAGVLLPNVFERFGQGLLLHGPVAMPGILHE